jgi:hypothetical protein
MGISRAGISDGGSHRRSIPEYARPLLPSRPLPRFKLRKMVKITYGGFVGTAVGCSVLLSPRLVPGAEQAFERLKFPRSVRLHADEPGGVVPADAAGRRCGRAFPRLFPSPSPSLPFSAMPPSIRVRPLLVSLVVFVLLAAASAAPPAVQAEAVSPTAFPTSAT